MKRGELTRDELILALELYFQYRDDKLVGDAAIKALAAELDRELAPVDVVIHAFAWDDPQRPWRTTAIAGEEARRVWRELKDDRAALKKAAAAIRKQSTSTKPA